MGRVQRVSPEAGQWVHGEPGLPGVHSASAQSVRVHDHFHRGAGLWRDSQGHGALHDFTTQEGQTASVL